MSNKPKGATRLKGAAKLTNVEFGYNSSVRRAMKIAYQYNLSKHQGSKPIRNIFKLIKY